MQVWQRADWVFIAIMKESFLSLTDGYVYSHMYRDVKYFYARAAKAIISFKFIKETFPSKLHKLFTISFSLG